MIRTRIAPSPTGQDIHIGNLYTALLNWVVAKKNNGSFVIRIEDTDRTRFVEGSEEKILASLAAFGITDDEGPDKVGDYGPYRQSDRLALYKKHAEELVEKGAAYYSFCSKEELDELRKLDKKDFRQALRNPSRAAFSKNELEEKFKEDQQYVIRLLVPGDKNISFNDLIRGEISFNTKEIDDQVLLKSDGFPTYHLAVVIDDYLMKISHVIRAEEWISSTPKHVLLYRAFGWSLPVYAHNPILRNPNKSKLSKRKNPVWASWYLDQGFLPKAILNYLALMGWSHPEEKEIFDMEEFIDNFALEDVHPVGPAFDPVKLEWMNGVYIRNLAEQDLYQKIIEFYGKQGIKLDEYLVKKTVPLIQERIKKLSDYMPLCRFLFEKPTEYEIEFSVKDKDLIKKIYNRLANIEKWTAAMVGEEMLNLAKEEGVKNKKFFQLLRVIITGKKISPPLNESMEILGKDECLERVHI